MEQPERPDNSSPAIAADEPHQKPARQRPTSLGRARQRVAHRPRGLFGGVLLLFVAGIVYLLTLTPGVAVGDSAEMQWVPHTLGVLHATGYPLYTLLGWAWSHVVPIGTVAWRMNAFSAVAAAMTVSLTYMLARRLTASAVAAIMAAWAVLASSLVWSQAVVAEVYALHLLFVVSLLYLLVRWAQSRSPLPRPHPGPPPTWGEGAWGRGGDQGPGWGHADRWLLAVALVAGLGLAHHRTILLLAPAALLFVFWVDRAFWKRGWLMLKALGLLLSGLLPYLYVPWRLGIGTQMLDVISGASFWRAFVALRPDWLALVPQLLLEQFSAPGVLVGLLGLWWLPTRPDRCQRPFGLLLLVYALAQIAFAVAYSVTDIAVFLLPVILVYALWIGAGVDAIWVALDRWSWARKPRALGGALLVLTALALLALRLPDWAAHSTAITAHAEAEVQRIRSVAQPSPAWAGRLAEPDAVLNVEGGIYGALLYHQAINGQTIPPSIQVYIPFARDYYDQTLAEAATRPVYLMYSYDATRVPARYRLTRQGEALRVTAAAHLTPTHLLRRPLTNDVELTGYDVVTGGLSLYWQTRRPIQHDFGVYVHYFAADLTPAGQQDKVPTGRTCYYPPSGWPPNEPILDLFDLPEGVTYARVGLTREEPALNTATVIQVGTILETGGNPVGETLGQLIDLLGYDLTRQGEVMRLTLYWRARQPVPRDYTVFVHALDADGRLITQRDQQPLGGFYPTSLWQPGEIIADRYELSPTSLCRRLLVGMYLWPSMERLRPPTGDAIPIELRP